MSAPHAPRSEAGQTLMLFIAAVGTLLGMVALVLDVGQLLVERRHAQNAADAAALAGAALLPGDPDAAVAAAAEYAASNGLSDGEIDSISVVTTTYPNDTLRVDVHRDVNFSFAPVLGVFGATAGASAAASSGSVAGGRGLAPFAVEQNVFAGLQPGDTTTLKYNAQDASNGNFLPLSLDSTGGSEYGQNIRYGSDQFLCAVGYERTGCNSVGETEPGNVVGPTRQALSWIMAQTSSSCDSYAEVFTANPSDPTRPALTSECNRFVNTTANSYRIILVPVIDQLCNGRCSVNILEFALFFIESYSCTGGGQGNSCDLNGRYAQATANIEAFFSPYDVNGSVKFVRLVE